jgi:hypothetical protein
VAQTAEYVMRSDVIPEETADDSLKWKVQFCIFSTMHYNNASVMRSIILFRFGSENYFAFNLPSTLVTSPNNPRELHLIDIDKMATFACSM